MKKRAIIIIGVLFLGLIGMTGFSTFEKKQQPPQEIGCTMEAKLCPDGSAVGRSGPACEFSPCPDVPQKISAPEFASPLDQVDKRVTKKPFGIFIDPKTSPVQPERFRGYHTGADFETFSEEKKVDVAVHAICTGPLAVKRMASGYGGVIVQRCTYDGEPITVTYGHMSLTSIDAKIGDEVAAGDTLGVLGAGNSEDTDSERKHLHLGIHKGDVIDIRGYVTDKQMLSAWLDPCQFVCKK